MSGVTNREALLWEQARQMAALRQIPSAKRGRHLYSWQVTDMRAARCLVLIAPYLRIKKQQAENCIALRSVKEKSKRDRVAPGRGHVGSAVRSPNASAAMEMHYAKAKELNRVGV